MDVEQDYPVGEGSPFVSSAVAVDDEPARKKVQETFGTPIPGTNLDPAKNDDPFALSPSWSKGRDYKKPFKYSIESSGQMVLLKRLDMGDLLKLGIAEQMDFMTKALMTDTKPEDTAKEAVSNAIMKAENFTGMESMINKVCLAGVLRPKPHQPPLNDDGEVDEEAKKENTFYIDEIPFNDRMELFSIIFDSEGLSTFRSEQTAGVGNVENVPSVSLPAD